MEDPLTQNPKAGKNRSLSTFSRQLKENKDFLSDLTMASLGHHLQKQVEITYGLR